MLEVTVPLPGEAATIAPIPAAVDPAPLVAVDQIPAETPTAAYHPDETASPVDLSGEAAPAPAAEEWPATEDDATLEMAPPDPWATQPGMMAVDEQASALDDDATILETPAFEPVQEPVNDTVDWPLPEASATTPEASELVLESPVTAPEQALAAEAAANETIAPGEVMASPEAIEPVGEVPADDLPLTPAEATAVEASVAAEPAATLPTDVPAWMVPDVAPVQLFASNEGSETAPAPIEVPAEAVAADAVGATEATGEEPVAEPVAAWEQPAGEPVPLAASPMEAVVPPPVDLAAQAAMMAAAAAAPVGVGAPVTVAVATTLAPSTPVAEPAVAAPYATAPYATTPVAAAPVAAAMAAPLAATALPAEAVVAAVPPEAGPLGDGGFLAGTASMTAAPAARPAGRSLPKHVTVSQLWFVMILSYASAITVMILYLVFGAKFGSAHQLESLPDVVPKETPAGKIRNELVSQGASMPPGHTLKLGQTERYGNLRVTPLRVVREPVEFTHYTEADTKKAPGETVLKLWMRFENVSKNQEFSPLGKDLLFARHQTAMDRGRDRSNTFVCPLDKKRQPAAAVLVYQHSFNDVWDLKDLKIDHWITPGETFETYIPTDPAGIDKLTGELVWRVHFRKGLNARSGLGVTTLIEVVFNSDQIETPGGAPESPATPPAEPENKDQPSPTKA